MRMLISQNNRRLALQRSGLVHTTFDKDHINVVNATRKSSFDLSLSDLINEQCKQLDDFWYFELNNSLTGGQYLEGLQRTSNDQANKSTTIISGKAILDTPKMNTNK